MLVACNLKVTLFTAAFISIAPASWAFARQGPPTWTELGGSATGGGVSNMDSFSTGANVAVGPDGFPWVMWQEQNALGKFIFVRRWNGNAWVEAGGSGSGDGIVGVASYQSQFPGALAVNSSGQVFAGFTQSARSCLVRWDGQSWEGLAGSDTGLSTGPLNSRLSSISIDPSGNPWVVMTASAGLSGEGEIYVLRWNGTAWAELGGSASGGGVSHSPTDSASDGRLAFGADGNPIVAWSDLGSAATESHVYVRRWDGSAWIEMGASGSGRGVSNLSKGHSYVGDLKVDSQGRPVVVWTCNENYPTEVYLRRWNGSSWVELAGSGSGHGISGFRMGGGGYEQSCEGGSLGFDPMDHPIVAWTEGNAYTAYQVRVIRWNGDAWEGIEGSFDESGLGAAPAGYVNVSNMAVNPEGDVFVAWQDGPVGGQEIYLRSWRNTRVGGLAQFRSDGSTPLSVGGSTTENEVVVQGQASRALVSFPLRLQFEFRRTDEPFTGIPMVQTGFTPSLDPVNAMISGLVLGSFRWRARAVESTGFTSAWQSFGDNPEAHADLWVVDAQPQAPEPTEPTSSGGGGGGSTGCGLLGLEAPLLVLFSSWIRRKRVR